MFPSRKDWTISLHFCVTGLMGRPNFTPLAFEFRHRYQDVHDQPSCGALLALSIGWEVQMSATPLRVEFEIICAR